jgi:hypothetical protein
MPESTLKEPLKHSLTEIFEELKEGRNNEDQEFLQECIEDLDL